MFVLLLASAWASCVDLPVTRARQRTLARDTPLVLTSSWGEAAHLAGRVRVRGPDGALLDVRVEQLGFDVRLVPRARWPVGTLTLEERGDHDEGGWRVTTRGQAARSAWYPLQSVEVVNGTAPALDPAGPITWSRTHSGTTPSLFARVEEVPEGARWLALEVEGVGPIAHRDVEGERTTVRDTSWLECHDLPAPHTRDILGFTHGLDLPVEGDLTVRVVAHGEAGARWDGPWTRLGPSHRHASCTLGDLPRRGGLRSWTPVEVTPDVRPLAPDSGGCGALELVDARETFVSEDTKLLVDDRGTVRRMDWSEGPLRVDGVLVPGARGRVHAMVSRQGAMWLALEDAIVAVREGRVVRRHLIGSARVTSMHLGPDGSLILGLHGIHGGRTRQVLSPDLTLVSVEPVRFPVEVDRSEPQVRVNGAPVPLEGRVGPHYVGPEHVLIVTRSNDGNGATMARLHLIASDGTRVWTRALAPDAAVEAAVVDDRGAVVRVTDASGPVLVRSVRGWNIDGSPRDAWPVVPPPDEDVTRTPWGTREIVAADTWIAVEQNGLRTPRWPLPHSAVLGTADTTLQIAALHQRWDDEGDWTILVEQTLRCTGVAQGVPERVPPQDAPPSP